jgi:hypothetical protein
VRIEARDGRWLSAKNFDIQYIGAGTQKVPKPNSRMDLASKIKELRA